MRRWIARTLVAGMLLSVPALAADVVYPGVSRIGMTPPAQLKPSRHFAGFESAGAQTVMLFNEFPASAYDDIANSLSAQALAADSLKIVSRGKLDGVQGEHLFVVADGVPGTGAGRRYVLLLKEKDVTGLVTVQTSGKAGEPKDAELRKALASVALRPALTPEQQLTGLPFSLPALGGFRLVRTLSGNAAMLTDGPLDTVKGVEQPFVIVAAAFSPVPSDQRESFPRRALLALPQVREVRVEQDDATGEGDKRRSEIVATARTGDAGDLAVIYQSVQYTPDGYLRVIGQGRLDQREALVARFRALAGAAMTKP